MHDLAEIFDRVTPVFQKEGNILEIGDRFQIIWTLFFAKTSIKVRANSNVIHIACQLANMINVVDNFFEITIHFSRHGLPTDPIWYQHPRVKCRADHRISFDQHTDLIVAELPVVIHECTTIIVTGPNISVEMIDRLPESIIAKMSDIQDDIKSLHLFQQ